VTHPRTRPSADNTDKQARIELVNLLAAQGRYWGAHRASLAAVAAEQVVAELVDLPPDRPESDIEGDLCTRLGECLMGSENRPSDARFDSNALAEATVMTATAAVRAALDELTTEPDGWRAPWRVLAAAARVITFPSNATVDAVIGYLHGLPGGRVLPRKLDGPTVTSEVLWTRDVYGSRFGITAAFAIPNGPDRWYLWDIDACGYQPFTVHSAYYDTQGQALAAWQAGVGHLAARDATFAQVDDPSLLTGLVPPVDGHRGVGGENAEQFAEYYRCRRLGTAAIEAVGRTPGARRKDLDIAAAAEQFDAWLQAHRVGQPQPDDLDVLVEELAGSWCLGGPAAVYGTCSPHRIALLVPHLRNYYEADFAADLVALLPAWASWLSARNGTAPELAERCLPYALGEPHAGIAVDHLGPNHLSRVIE
jgi:hypothetical protein